MNPIPIVILSGFLGAGKTTLLNRLIANGLSGKRFAVIVNDFGKLNIDASLMDADGREVLELANGCVCCSLAAGLIDGLDRLVKNRELDLVLIEASGVTSLTDLSKRFDDQSLRERYRVSKVITVVDARRYTLAQGKIGVINDQARGADVLILNRIDSVDTDTVDESLALLRDINPSVPILKAQFCDVDIERLFQADSMGRDRRDGSIHDHWYACTIAGDDTVDTSKAVEYVRTLPESILRVKGFWADGESAVEIQRVGMEMHTKQMASVIGAEEKGNCLTAISNVPIEGTLAKSAEPLPGISIKYDHVPHDH